MIDQIGFEIPEDFRPADVLSVAHNHLQVTGEDGTVFFVTEEQYQQLLSRRQATPEADRS